ncbi:MAG TPA: hypothetical protein PLD59_12925, partial [Tepidisphaeraceae bacterium]|nr:hypothetical protein [Tepidisphaeraceae bacterium]
HKQKTYGKMGGERILLADGLGYFLEAGNVPVTGVTASQSVGVSYVSYADDGYLKGPVTTVDLYRHGKLAPLLPGGTLVSTTGGRIAFNALYSDGHVETKYDKKDAWRGLRMRFPN